LTAALRRGEAPPEAGLVVFDEAHHYAAEDWAGLARAYGSSPRIGLTATPERGDGVALGSEGLFDALVPVAQPRELIAAGVLVHCAVYAPETPVMKAAEFPAVAYLEHGRGLRGFVFVRTVGHAQQVADALTAADHPAAVIHGQTPGPLRAALLESFRLGEAGPLLELEDYRSALAARGEEVRAIRALVSCETLTEGVDVPAAEVCVLACKNNHAGAYLQRVGRVLRAAPGKDRAIVIDLFGNVLRHGLPDADREYSLEGKAIEVRGKKSKPEPTSCPDCGAVFERWRVTADNRRCCPECKTIGAVLPDPAEVDRKVLHEAGAFVEPDKRRKRLELLIAEAARKGWKRGAVYHRYHDLFGVNMSRAEWAYVKERRPEG
jgi:superfamily II DNA or RNA helicase